MRTAGRRLRDDGGLTAPQVIKRIEISTDPALARARGIVRRIRTRDLYKAVNECTIPTQSTHENMKPLTAAELATFQARRRGEGAGGLGASRWGSAALRCATLLRRLAQVGDGGVRLREDDIVVQNLTINWAAKSKNPVDKVKFYQNIDSTEADYIHKDKVSPVRCLTAGLPPPSAGGPSSRGGLLYRALPRR